MIQTTFDIDVAFEELTKEIDVAIGREVQRFYVLLKEGVARDVWLEGDFFKGFKDPKRIGEYSWEIINTAPHAVVLARGRRTINGKAYGSKKWYNGLNPMLKKLEADIIKATDKIKV